MLQCCQVGRCSCRSVASSAAPSIDPGRLCLLFDVAAARGSNLQPTDSRQLPRRSCVTQRRCKSACLHDRGRSCIGLGLV